MTLSGKKWNKRKRSNVTKCEAKRSSEASGMPRGIVVTIAITDVVSAAPAAKRDCLCWHKTSSASTEYNVTPETQTKQTLSNCTTSEDKFIQVQELLAAKKDKPRRGAIAATVAVGKTAEVLIGVRPAEAIDTLSVRWPTGET